jgi:hypothetical protein
MAQKPTSLAAQIAENAKKDQLAAAKEDARFAGMVTEDGRVWVRLLSAHYSADGNYYDAGSVALLDATQVPKSAKVLTPKEAAAETPADAE